MVNFYTDYVSCSGQASLTDVAGRWGHLRGHEVGLAGTS